MMYKNKKKPVQKSCFAVKSGYVHQNVHYNLVTSLGKTVSVFGTLFSQCPLSFTTTWYAATGSDKMSKLTANWGYEDSLTSKKHKKIDKDSLPKDIQQKLKSIEKAFR